MGIVSLSATESLYELWWQHREGIGGICLARLHQPGHAPAAIRKYRKDIYTFPVTATVGEDGKLHSLSSARPRQFGESEGFYVVTDAEGEEHGRYQARVLMRVTATALPGGRPR